MPSSVKAFSEFSTEVLPTDGTGSMMSFFVNLPIVLFTAFLTKSIAEALPSTKVTFSSKSLYLTFRPWDSRKGAAGQEKARKTQKEVYIVLLVGKVLLNCKHLFSKTQNRYPPSVGLIFRQSSEKYLDNHRKSIPTDLHLIYNVNK